MQLICPECKNFVDVSTFSHLASGQVVECNSCGITLMVTTVNGSTAEAEVVDEMK